MKVLGIETSCDECAAAIVEDGKYILSNIVATQIPVHAKYKGVVPEIASRKHTEWINLVVQEALDNAKVEVKDIDAVAATSRPGLLGSLLVGLGFAKAFAWARGIPFIAIDHMLAHLYAPMLEHTVQYPFLGLLVSGGHSIICRADNYDDITVLGATIDDAVGEAFDKVSGFYDLGYPGGKVIDDLAGTGDSNAFKFPLPSLHKGDHRYDLSYSGLKTAAVNQLDLFCAPHINKPYKLSDIAASFQKTAIDILLRSLFRAIEDTGLNTVVAGGGVAANSYLRSVLAKHMEVNRELTFIFPSMELCGDNGAMIAGLAYQYLLQGIHSPLKEIASARVKSFKRGYP
ncbi:MAG: tRNA (adenosine(37)-N6)-threonylcarbamoyltransferase complex transferase subunit TsaD [Treponema sp.]|nr:tRNA (adenosine(37)-N6)-threonylcarbamoyltransferase complex transferase subunit TsaD [Treponema sp.]